MSGFLFLTGQGALERASHLPPGALAAALAARGADVHDEWEDEGARCLLVRHAWERDPDLAGAALVTSAHGVVGVADASLYYRTDLLRALRSHGVHPRGETPSHLILAAWAAWGPECVERLEGDYAFALWDPRERLLFAARSPSGVRDLYSTVFARGFALASSPIPLVRLLGDGVRVSTEGLLRALTFRSGDGTGTAWLDIDEIPPGHALRFGPGGQAVVSCFGRPRRDPSAARLSEEEAVRETRRLLTLACAERAPSSGVSVAMSGGYDSTAIYGALRSLDGIRPSRSAPRAVTLAFPEGDPGNEDRYVQAVLDFWGGEGVRVDTESIPVVDPTGPVTLRGVPWAHHFEQANRALARAAHARGSRVLLHGMAGDELFDVSPEYMADLFRRGRWGELLREWRAMELESFRMFRRFCLRPLVPDWVLGLRAALNGRERPAHPLGAPHPPWVSRDALHHSRIVERDRGTMERFRSLVRHGAGASVADRERFAALIRPDLSRVIAMLHEATLREGAELRGPFLDRRLVEFVLSRPREELVRRGESKRLLRKATQSLLPEEVLAPRSEITGSPEAYFLRSFRAAVPALLSATEEARDLADLGLVDRAAFRTAVRRFMHGESRFALSIFHTLQTELWLTSWRAASRQEDRVPAPKPAQPLLSRSA